MPIKIATLNLCLGLQFKKNLVKEFILNEKIDILCMQETEIKNNIALPNLTIPGFDIEIEHNVKCSRVGIYIKSGLNYIRRTELEGRNSHVIIVDIIGKKNYCIINIY